MGNTTEETIMSATNAAAAAGQIYRERLFKLVGDENPLDVLARTASTLDGIVSSHSPAILRTRPFEGKWTPNEIIGHLTDSEWVYGYRYRLIFSQNNPVILGTEQEAWVSAQRHNDREPSELVQLFRTLRQFNLATWKRATPADLARTGQHNERGPESLGEMLRMLAGHDLSHLNQITRYIEAIPAQA
jgi:hypothetical protein